MTLFQDNLSPYLTIVEATEPSAPAAGQDRVYVDSTTHLLMITNSSGTQRSIEGLTNVLTTTGDIIYSSSGTTAARLAVGTATQVLHGGASVPAYSAVVEGDLSTSDITTANATTAKHGFLLKLDNSSTHFMNGQGAWTTPSGSGHFAHAISTRTAGNLSLTSTTAANLDTGMDLTLACSTGDIIQVNLNGLHDNSAHIVNLDVITVTGSNYLGAGLASSAQGMLGWSKQAGAYTNIAGSMTYVVQSGDISGGNVVLRLRYKVDGATSLIYATADLLLRFSATVTTPA